MMKRDKARKHVDDLRGASRLAVEATRGVTDLVQAMHRTIAGGPDILGRPLAAPAKLLTDIAYGSVKGVTKLVGVSIDAALAQLAPLLGQSVPGLQREAVLSVLNGVLGDYLKETKNPLAIAMSLRCSRAENEKTNKVLVLVHGSSMNDLMWKRADHDHGESLASDFGYTPVYVHYNSGLHISENGVELARQLDELAAEWPVPVESIALLGHSMGGLVSRSAVHRGQSARHAWRRKLRKLVTIGSPHHGAPLERGGAWVDFLLGISRYSAPLARLGKIRSAGVTDLRFGIVRTEDWLGRDRFEHAGDPRTPLALPTDIECYALAGTTTSTDEKKLASDGLVPVDSALGRHAKREHTLAFTKHSIALGTSHLDLLSSAVVYETLRDWL